MSVYSFAVRTAAAAAATFSGASAAFFDIWPSANGRAQIMEIGMFNTTATSCAVALLRASARGTNSTTQLANAHDVGDAAGITSFDSAWSVNPTIGAATTIFRRAAIPAAIGGGIIWVFPDNEPLFTGLNANGVALINPIGTGQILDVYVTCRE